MKKQELIDILILARNNEEGATANYYEHLKALFSRFVRDKVPAKRAQEIFHFLIKENKKHENMLITIIAQLQKEDKNDY